MTEYNDNVLSLYGEEHYIHGLFHRMEQTFVSTGSEVVWLEVLRDEMRAASPQPLPATVEELRGGRAMSDPAYSDDEDGPCLTLDFRSRGGAEDLASTASALLPFSSVILASWPARTEPPNPMNEQVWVNGSLVDGEER